MDLGAGSSGNGVKPAQDARSPAGAMCMPITSVMIRAEVLARTADMIVRRAKIRCASASASKIALSQASPSRAVYLPNSVATLLFPSLRIAAGAGVALEQDGHRGVLEPWAGGTFARGMDLGEPSADSVRDGSDLLDEKIVETAEHA